MNRGELEAAIWKTMKAHQVTSPSPVRFTDTLLALADHYAASSPENRLTEQARAALIARRRAVLDPVLANREMIMHATRADAAAIMGVSETSITRYRRRLREAS